MQLTAAEIARATAGTLLQGAADTLFDGVSIDSRTTVARNLFVPLTGTQVDGHTFIPAALGADASGTLCHRGWAPAHGTFPPERAG